MSETAWAAGFFEGEGCISLDRSRVTHRVKLSLNQVDPEPLRRFALWAETGAIHSRPKIVCSTKCSGRRFRRLNPDYRNHYPSYK